MTESGLDSGVAFVCSWSGGKDSCLALHRAIQAGAEPRFLLSMLREDGARSRSHGLEPAVLEAQAASLGIPLITRPASWDEYESVFVGALQELEAEGVRAGVFGDIDLDDHRAWEEKVCAAAGIEPYLPLWQSSRAELLDELIGLGFEAIVVAVNAEKLAPEFLGRALDHALVREFEQMGIDLCGEEGEYHTVVVDGPIFARSLSLDLGTPGLYDGYWFLEPKIRETGGLRQV